MARVLIIKQGYSETLDAGISRVPSLGDVLRTTVILHPFANDHVTWLVDEGAYPLLAGNPCIKELLVYNEESVRQLQNEQYDVVINLEKVPEICSLADSINAPVRHGFRLNPRTGQVEPCNGCEAVFSLCTSTDLKRNHGQSWQESLLQVVGEEWQGQEYILGFKPESMVTHDVGLNWAVGAKWPNKSWPRERWVELKHLLDGEFSWSMQQGMDNLHAYMNWINSCRCLVTNDSLGLHIAVALKKKVVVLYGPTSPSETFFYNRAEVVSPRVDYTCIPCLFPSCDREINCMEFIAAAEVKRRIEMLFGSGR